MRTMSDETARQVHVARAKANAVRTAKSRSKADLKGSRQDLVAALELECWQSSTVLELLGYACVAVTSTPGSWHASHPHKPSPSAGRMALGIAAELQIGHFTRVSALSTARRAALVDLFESYARSPANSRSPAVA